MQIFYQPLVAQGVNYLEEEESRHAVKVLRLKEGASITLIDGLGGLYEAIITKANHRKCEFEVIKKEQDSDKRPYYIHIAIAPTKNIDRLEWFVEKSVEFGVDEISLLLCEHSERKTVKNDRLLRKAISASKQSLKTWVPKINPSQKFNDFIDNLSDDQQRMIAYVDHNIPQHLKEKALNNKKYCILIGPEGDFSPSEIEKAFNKGFEAISLGKSRLRTETAGVAACHILNLINE
ncbi:16S rRNA (uracil(1498)-N(3))-methyltransferase [Xanthovirga aplysinae]|uniref:16S rRNA (uracil(1498)-N(3))-methyltransferase n=1 Tax=Xanthovirga aplysinae TaxID=2529853 RepID=UPI0012BD4D31|nr:16S rRNA (uracil(1498)-N(3))-methyltransferase [Xanthovirga aplysinae]MTI31409.1 16S rRNA (uracil(1498)-N(3))-methyltransferase [Xanthovirga aplysinae]